MTTEPMTLDALTAIKDRVMLNLAVVEAVLRRTQRTVSLLNTVDDFGALPAYERVECDAFLLHTLRLSEMLLRAFIDADEYRDNTGEERPYGDLHGKRRGQRRSPRRAPKGTARRNQPAPVVSLVASAAQSTSPEQEAQ